MSYTTKSLETEDRKVMYGNISIKENVSPTCACTCSCLCSCGMCIDKLSEIGLDLGAKKGAVEKILENAFSQNWIAYEFIT